jgi:glyoxylase-like metal-dependent hydrolase (beta-lactamase superfamily II)
MSQMTRISRFGFVNAYLISEDDGLTLIDTMLPRSAKPIEESARRLGAPSPARLAPGHGKVIEAPGATMGAAITRVRELSVTQVRELSVTQVREPAPTLRARSSASSLVENESSTR